MDAFYPRRNTIWSPQYPTFNHPHRSPPPAGGFPAPPLRHHPNPPLLPLPFSRSASLPPPRPAAPPRRHRPASSPRPRPKEPEPRPRIPTGLVQSPPPSSLPLPRFALRPRPGPPRCNAEALDGADAEELLRLLRL